LQRETGCLDHRVIERLIAGRQGLQGKHLAPLLRAHGDVVGDGVTQQRIHRPRLLGIPDQIAVLGITFQQSLPLQETADAVSEGVGRLA